MKKTFLAFLACASTLCVVAQELKLTADNINEIINSLTLAEKVSLIVGCHDAYTSMPETMIGHQERIVPGAAGTSTAVARLGIPPTVFTDGPAGVRISERRDGTDSTFFATGFPIATALASSWNTDLVYEATAAMGNEVLEYGCDVLLAPGTNIHRHPLCGRNFEYFSEDPLLSGKMSAAYINGVQSNGVGTSIKHFAANNQETLRMYNDSRVDERTLREIYYKPFEIALRESNPWTVMSSYNKLNGIYTQYSYNLLTTVLRDEWGYDGLVVTDWTGTRNTVEQLRAGNDHLQPGTDQQTYDLIKAVEDSTLSIDIINNAVRRMLQYIMKTPRYKGYKYSDAPDLRSHGELVRRVGSECMVLLKNDNHALPMQPNQTVALFGVTSYDMIAGGTGSGDVHKAYISQLSDALTAQGHTLTPDLMYTYLNYKIYAQCYRTAELGPNAWKKPHIDEAPMSRATIIRQAEAADLAIFTIGRVAGESTDVHQKDFGITPLERQILTDLCEEFHLKGKPVIVVINASNVIETASWKDLPDAIIMAWQPGQEVGNSIADVLTGAVCPSGKLPTTFPVSCIDHLSSRNFPLFGGNEKMAIQEWAPRSTMEYTNYEEGVYVGYRYFETFHKPVSYPFGYGLSYTTFSYTQPKIRRVGDAVEVSVTVRNTGAVAGKEVVQLYVTAPQGTMEKPTVELKAFAKTRLLQPGEEQQLTMRVTHYELASFDAANNQWITEAGKYQFHISTDVQTPQHTLTYQIKKALSYPKTYNYVTNK